MLLTNLLVPHLVSSLSLAAAGSDQGELSPFVGTFLMGTLFTGFGALAYSGVWRWWARRRSRSVYKVFPLGIGWSGVGLMATGLGVFIPGEAAGIVVYPALAFAALGIVGTVWLPRPFLPRWYKVEMGLESRASRRRVVVPESRSGRPPLRGPLGEDLKSSAGSDFGAAPTLGGAIGGVAGEVGNGRSHSGAIGDAKQPTMREGDT